MESLHELKANVGEDSNRVRSNFSGTVSGEAGRSKGKLNVNGDEIKPSGGWQWPAATNHDDEAGHEHGEDNTLNEPAVVRML